MLFAGVDIPSWVRSAGKLRRTVLCHYILVMEDVQSIAKELSRQGRQLCWN
jgi:hypothetical protein